MIKSRRTRLTEKKRRVEKRYRWAMECSSVLAASIEEVSISDLHVYLRVLHGSIKVMESLGAHLIIQLVSLLFISDQ